MRTRFSSHLSVRSARTVPTTSVDSAASLTPLRAGRTARRLTLALAASAPFCAGALLARPIQAAPTVESDENGPLVQIVKPGYNDVLKGNYRILIQVTARKYNPQSVEMFIDDVSATKGPMEISSFASSSYDFDTRLLTDGRHKLTVRVTDSQGFRGWSEVTVFVNNKGIVDTQIPDLKWVGIQPFQEFSGSMKIEVDAADNFGVKMLQLSISPADAHNKPAYSWMMNQPPYRVNLDTIGKNIPDGLYVLKALAFDSLDQQGEAPPLTVGVLNDQINATRVEDMLDGKRQMAQILNGEKVAEKTASTKTVAPKASETPAKVVEKPAKVAAVATPAPAVAATSQGINKTSTYQAPKLTIPQQTPSNPGIQLPRVSVPATPEVKPTEPQISEVPTNEARIAQLTPTETALSEVETATTVAEIPAQADATTAATSDNSAIEAATSAEVAPADATSDETAQTNFAPTQIEENATAENATETPDKKTLVAALPSKPINQRNAGEATMSRAATVDLALAPASQFENKRAAAPIAVARFSHPQLSGRAISDAPMWSQTVAGDESRLSNAQLLRARAGKTRVLNAARPVNARNVAPVLAARALQTSVPTLNERPIFGRAISANSLSTPANKLTREAQGQNAPLAAPKAATASPLSKAVRDTKRAQPIAPAIAVETPTKLRGDISKTVNTAKRAQPIEIAPNLVAKSNVKPALAPQMSAPMAPRMSESASGLGAPSRLSKAVQRLTGKAQAIGSLDGERVAALPRPDAAKSDRSGASIVAVPLDAPLQVAASQPTEIPASYRAEQTTTVRAIAAHFGLPVELVAISNGWTSETKVMRGAEVKLPRPLQISYNGAQVKGDTPSMLMGDTAVTAFRFMFEKTGGKLEWDAANHRVVARKDGREIVLSIGSNVAKIGDQEVMMDIAAFLFQGRTMVPLRFFEEGMNAQVEWNPQTGRLVVAMAG